MMCLQQTLMVYSCFAHERGLGIGSFKHHRMKRNFIFRRAKSHSKSSTYNEQELIPLLAVDSSSAKLTMTLRC